jgi:hypothetical protein
MLLTPPKNLSAVSLTPAINFRLFGYFSLVSTTPGKMLSPVSLIPAINCSLVGRSCLIRNAFCQTNRLFILLEGAEKEICFSMANGMFKMKMDTIATVPDLCLTTVNILTHLISPYQLPLGKKYYLLVLKIFTKIRRIIHNTYIQYFIFCYECRRKCIRRLCEDFFRYIGLKDYCKVLIL